MSATDTDGGAGGMPVQPCPAGGADGGADWAPVLTMGLPVGPTAGPTREADP